MESTVTITHTILPPNALQKHFNNCGDQSTSATITIKDYDQVHWHWVPYSDGGRAKDSCSSASCAQQVALKEKKKTQFLDRSSLRPQICSLSSTPQCRNSQMDVTPQHSKAISVWGWMDGILLLEHLVVLNLLDQALKWRQPLLHGWWSHWRDRGAGDPQDNLHFPWNSHNIFCPILKINSMIMVISPGNAGHRKTRHRSTFQVILAHKLNFQPKNGRQRLHFKVNLNLNCGNLECDLYSSCQQLQKSCKSKSPKKKWFSDQASLSSRAHHHLTLEFIITMVSKIMRLINYFNHAQFIRSNSRSEI